MENVLKVTNNKFIYDKYHAVFYIPDDFMKRGYCEQIDDGYMLLGLVESRHYITKDMEKSGKFKSASVEFPVKFQTIPSNVTIEKVDIGHGLQRYHLFHYYKGDIMMNRNQVITDPGNVEQSATMMMEGRLDIIDYGRIPVVYTLSKLYNKTKLGVPAFYEETYVAEVYKSLQNPTEPSRLTAKPNSRVRGYTLRETGALGSTFSASTFEDPLSMFTVCDVKANSGEKEIVSDIEKIARNIY